MRKTCNSIVDASHSPSVQPSIQLCLPNLPLLHQLLPSTHSHIASPRRFPTNQITHKNISHPQHTTPDVEFHVEFKVYPYPPTRRPLCTPLLPSTLKSQSIRKRILRRWKSDYVSLPVPLPCMKRCSKRYPKYFTSQVDNGETGISIRQKSSLSVTSPFNEETYVGHTDRDHRSDKFLQDYSIVGSDVRKRFRHSSNPTIVEDSTVSPPDNVQGVHTMSTRDDLSFGERIPKMHTKRAFLQHRINALRQIRAEKEIEELNEIAHLAETRLSNDTKVTSSERAQLKADLESLRPQAVRDVMRLFSHHLQLEESTLPHEIRVQLDMLPSEFLRQLQTVVDKEKGLLDISSSRLLISVRKELKEAIQEWRDTFKKES